MANGVLIGALEFYGDATKYSGDPGTVTNPYCISDRRDLRTVSSTITTPSNYILTDNIDFYDHCVAAEAGFTITLDESFDFNGFCFRNLNIAGIITDSGYRRPSIVFDMGTTPTNKDKHIRGLYFVNFIYNNSIRNCIVEFRDSSGDFTGKVCLYNTEVNLTLIHHSSSASDDEDCAMLFDNRLNSNNIIIFKDTLIRLSGREEWSGDDGDKYYHNLFAKKYDDISGFYFYNLHVDYNNFKIVIVGSQSDYLCLFPKVDFSDCTIYTGNFTVEVGEKHTANKSNWSWQLIDGGTSYSSPNMINTIINCNVSLVSENPNVTNPTATIVYSHIDNIPCLFINKEKFGSNISFSDYSTEPQFYFINDEQVRDPIYLSSLGLLISDNGKLL
jgi:hypothetical protein